MNNMDSFNRITTKSTWPHNIPINIIEQTVNNKNKYSLIITLNRFDAEKLDIFITKGLTDFSNTFMMPKLIEGDNYIEVRLNNIELIEKKSFEDYRISIELQRVNTAVRKAEDLPHTSESAYVYKGDRLVRREYQGSD